MFYAAELRFLKDALRRCGLHVCTIDPTLPVVPQLEDQVIQGILSVLDPAVTLSAHLEKIEHNTIYRIRDPFLCSYMFFQLPGLEPEQLLLQRSVLQSSAMPIVSSAVLF